MPRTGYGRCPAWIGCLWITARTWVIGWFRPRDAPLGLCAERTGAGMVLAGMTRSHYVDGMGPGVSGGFHATRTTLRTPRVDRLLCRRDGCDVGAIPAVPRVGGAIWGRDRIDEGPGGAASFPMPAIPDVPEGRVSGWPPDWGGGFGGRTIPTVPRVDRAIWGRDRIAWAPAVDSPPDPQCPRRTHLEPAAQLRRRLQRWGDTAVPGVGEAIRGRDRIWACAGVEAPPPPRPYPQCPRRTRLGPALGWRDGCDLGALPPQCRGAGAHPGQRSYWAGADRGAPHHPGHTRSAPEKDAPWMRISWEAGTGAANRVQGWHLRWRGTRFRAAGSLPYAGCPGSFRAAGGGTDRCRCGG